MQSIICSLHHFEHFVLKHSKIKAICCSAKKSPSLLILLIFISAIIDMREKGIAVFIFVTFICDVKVMYITKSWPEFLIIKNCILFLFLNKRHFFPKLQLQQKRTVRRISYILTIFFSLPFLTSECGYSFIKLSTDDCDIIWGFIAVSVECSSLKIMLRSPKNQL